MTREKPLCPTRRETQAMMGADSSHAGPPSVGGPAMQAVLPLAGGRRGEVGGQAGHDRGIIQGHINAVQDPLELAALLVDNTVHAVGVESRRRLLGVGGRDCGDISGGHNGALHQIHVPLVGQHPLGKKLRPRPITSSST